MDGSNPAPGPVPNPYGAGGSAGDQGAGGAPQFRPATPAMINDARTRLREYGNAPEARAKIIEKMRSMGVEPPPDL